MSEVEQDPTQNEQSDTPDSPDHAQDTPPDPPDNPEQPDDQPGQPDEDQPATPDQTPTPDPAASGMSAAQAEKAAKDAAADWNRLRQRTIDRWEGEGEYLRDCPLCLDQHKGLVDLRHAGNYPREAVDAVMGFLGLAREQDYKQSGSHNACTFCDANGKVATGSKVPEFTTVTCPECNGYGYTPPPTPSKIVVDGPVGNVVQLPPPTDDLEHGEVDDMGEPRVLPDGRLNPNYGMRPAYKVMVEPFGVTAGLTTMNAPAAAP